MVISSRRFALLLVACLCVTAGCNSFIQGPDPQTTTTSTLQGQLAPGLTAQGVTDVSTLTEAHERILQEDSYTVTRTSAQRYSNGTVRYRFHSRIQRGSNGSHFYSRTRYPTSSLTFADSSLQRYEYYGTSDTVYQRYIAQNNTTMRVYNRSEVPVLTTFTSREYLYTVLSAFNHTHGFTVTEVPNSSPPRYHIHLTRLDSPAIFANYLGLQTMTNASLTAAIDRWGVIHRYNLTYTGQANNQTVSGSRTIRFTKTGSTHVPQPSWIHNATTSSSPRRERDQG